MWDVYAWYTYDYMFSGDYLQSTNHHPPPSEVIKVETLGQCRIEFAQAKGHDVKLPEAISQ